MAPCRLTRREWLSASGLLLSSVLCNQNAGAQAPPPRSPDWIRTGHIGLGIRGRQLLQAAGEGALAVCDLDEERLRQGAAMAPPGVRGYRDYRELLADRDVEAVVIATPTHWHAIQAIHALEAGKDVYIAAPVCLRFGEGDDLLRAARSFGGVCGVGHEDARWTLASQEPRATYYMRAPVHTPPNETLEDDAPPWWATWLGPARARMYAPHLARGGHRDHPDLGLGQVGLTGAQFFYALMAANQLSEKAAVSVETTALAFSQHGSLPAALECHWQFDAQDIYWEQAAVGGDRCALGVQPSGASLWSGSFAETVEHVSLRSWLQRVRDRDTTLTPLTRAIRAATLAQAAILAGRVGAPIQLPATDVTASTDPILRSHFWQPEYAAYRFTLEPSHGV